ncbi:NUDIX domain-containing protein [Buttiauxella sp.]|uniref:NUDIX domain-containing protein n=1 Tax=Buttiauxella sp. TaxID=1972222 RepID=UPI003C727305
MAKIYLILTDGKNVLVAKGGKSGNPPKVRGGYHLPGGKYESRDKNSLGTVIRELKEETGITLKNPQQLGKDLTPENTGGAKFVIVQTESVPDWVEWFDKLDEADRPKVTNIYDEPFTGLISLPLENCWKDNNFNNTFYTDYFGLGLKEACKILGKD